MKSTITTAIARHRRTRNKRQCRRCVWSGLKGIAQDQHKTMSNMVGKIEASRIHGNLSSAIRLFVLDDIRQGPGIYWRRCQTLHVGRGKHTQPKINPFRPPQ